MEDEASLREAVEAQAEALVAGDLATFASYATPGALTQFYRTPAVSRARSFEIGGVDAGQAPARSVVSFRGGTPFDVVGSWERTPTGWKAISMTIPRDTASGSWWRKFVPGKSPAELPAREDLS